MKKLTFFMLVLASLGQIPINAAEAPGISQYFTEKNIFYGMAGATALSSYAALRAYTSPAFANTTVLATLGSLGSATFLNYLANKQLLSSLGALAQATGQSIYELMTYLETPVQSPILDYFFSDKNISIGAIVGAITAPLAIFSGYLVYKAYKSRYPEKTPVHAKNNP